MGYQSLSEDVPNGGEKNSGNTSAAATSAAAIRTDDKKGVYVFLRMQKRRDC
jgi:hypothetical protein